jgi:hypothetical protein
MSWTWEHDDDEGFDGHDHEDDESPIRGGLRLRPRSDSAEIARVMWAKIQAARGKPTGRIADNDLPPPGAITLPINCDKCGLLREFHDADWDDKTCICRCPTCGRRSREAVGFGEVFCRCPDPEEEAFFLRTNGGRTNERTMMTDDERREHRQQLLAKVEAKREAAWERYCDTAAMRLVLANPEPGDLRLAFEAGWHARDIQIDE